ncbi:MAG: hypothetical protein HUN04_15775 [Desulfobacter sp.]|nr:MAG: hypothetical protein HUN04_15775 [Desulfobacter sp.]
MGKVKITITFIGGAAANILAAAGLQALSDDSAESAIEGVDEVEEDVVMAGDIGTGLFDAMDNVSGFRNVELLEDEEITTE